MSGTGPAVGSISWVDLTVPDAPGVRDFYAAVTGWRPSPVAISTREYHGRPCRRVGSRTRQRTR